MLFRSPNLLGFFFVHRERACRHRASNIRNARGFEQALQNSVPFLYRRVAGIEAIGPGYKTFAVKPVPGGGLTWAKGSVSTPYGLVSAEWKAEGSKFTVSIQVPVGTACRLTLPDGSEKTYGSGKYTASCPWRV